MMDLEKSLPQAEAFVEAEQAGTPDSEPNCLNCDAVLTGPYCAQCGQKRIPRRQTLGELLINFVSSFISFESKFFRTGKYLLFHPGRLPIDYNSGKRERHYHPARLYVFISFVFFLLNSTLPDPDKTKIVNYSDQNSSEFKMEDFDTVVGQYNTPEQYDSAQRALPLEERDGFWMRMIREREIKINQRYKGKGNEFGDAFQEIYSANIPKIFFLLLPLFALILKLLYIRKDFYYSEHLVFSIYYYNFFFLAGSIFMLIELIPYVKFLNVALTIWIILYMLLAMRRVYRQSWWKTLLKFGTFVFVFCFFIVTAMLVNLAIALIFI
jgi:hypothetical protein